MSNLVDSVSSGKQEKKYTLVTGGCGFIGSRIVRMLCRHHYVLVFDNLSTGLLSRIDYDNRITFVFGDIRNQDSVDCLFKNYRISHVFHFAALCYVSDSIEHPADYFNVNLTGTHNLLKSAKENQVEFFVFASSSCIYGNISNAKESSTPNPISPYASSKFFSECALQKSGIKGCSLRFANVVGSGEISSSQRIVPTCIKCSLSGKELTIFGDGNQIRDYIHVDDAVKASLLALEKKCEGSLNIGSSALRLSVNQVVEICQSLHSIPPIHVRYVNARHGECQNSSADYHLATHSLGFTPIWNDFKAIVQSIVKEANSSNNNVREESFSYPIVRSFKIGGDTPFPSNQDTIGSRLVLLVRHGTRVGGNSSLPSIDEPLSDSGRNEAIQLGDEIKTSGLLVKRVLYSPSLRCKETALLLTQRLSQILPPELIQNQLLGFHGPFIADCVKVQEMMDSATSLGTGIKFLTDIVEGCDEVPSGHISRDLGLERLVSDLTLFTSPGTILVAVTHDLFIAALKRYIGFDESWPQPACGILFDLSSGFASLKNMISPASKKQDQNDTTIIDTKPEWVIPYLDSSLNRKNATLAIYGMPHAAKGFIHDHNITLFYKGHVVSSIESERISRIKHDSHINMQLDVVIDTMIDLLPKGVDFDVVLVNSCSDQSDCYVTSSNEDFVSGVKNGIKFNPTSSSLLSQKSVQCRWKTRKCSAVVVSHEIAHVFCGISFFGCESSKENHHLLIHFDGAASISNFTAWDWKDDRFRLLECDWCPLSKYFNDNGLMFAIIGAPREQHLSAPGKLMALASYGKPKSHILQFLRQNKMFHNCWDLDNRTEFCDKARSLFGWQPKIDNVTGKYIFDSRDPFLHDILATFQEDFTSQIVEKIKNFQQHTSCTSLILSGGCFLNIHLTNRLEKAGFSVFIPPCCSDSGLSIGAGSFIEYLKHRHIEVSSPYILNYNLPSYVDHIPSQQVIESVARAIMNEKIIGVCRGYGESGPRALGNRSILALPTLKMRSLLSEQKKQREWYRPLAPVMLLRNAQKVLVELKKNKMAFSPTSRFMLTQFTIAKEFQSQLAGVVHCNGTARVQILSKREENPFLFDLLLYMDERYNQIALINTSFNRKGEPIVHSFQDAIAASRAMELDFLVLGSTLVRVPPKLRVLLVIHGYPPRYNAGSEVYTQKLAHSLYRQGHEVAVCARTEDHFQPDFSLTKEVDDIIPSITIFLINMPRSQYRFHHSEFDMIFQTVLSDFNPYIVHVGHLSHLSLGLIKVVKKASIPIVFTLHDFWLSCPRGQFLHWDLTSDTPYSTCSGYNPKKCASTCFNRIHTGTTADQPFIDSLQSWFDTRKESVNEVVRDVDLFISPSRQLMTRMLTEMPLMKGKTVYIDYGFSTRHIPKRPISFRTHPSKMVFGFIGRHHPSKGIDLLIKSISLLRTKDKVNLILRIWGRPEGQLTAGLRRLIRFVHCEEIVEWFPEYQNDNIYKDVFLHCDAIVVPSIWDENSPLVLHEALQARVPIITANHGGMEEFVKDGINGFTFSFRNIESLSQTILRAIEQREKLFHLASRGYLEDKKYGDVISIDHQARHFTLIYNRLLKLGPRRCTFDYQIDRCNLHCIMCEGFSSHRAKDPSNSRSSSSSIDVDSLHSLFVEASLLGMEEAIPTTMGEPLLTPFIDQFFEWCSRWNVKLNLTTNGTWPRRSVEEWAEVILPFASDVKISWNGATKETQEGIMVGSNWRKRVDDLEKFIAFRNDCALKASITLQVTFLEKNLKELPDIIRFAAENGVNRVKGHHLWVFYDEMKDQNMRRSSESRKRWNTIAEECQKIAGQYQLKLENFHQLSLYDSQFETESLTVGDIEDCTCPFLGHEAWFNPNIVFSPCCAPDESRRSLGDFGSISIKSQSLYDIWNGEKYQGLCQNYLQHSLCKTCLLRRPNTPSTPSCSPTNNVNTSVHTISRDGTHHVNYLGVPLYPQRYSRVLSFHDPPGLAPAQLSTEDGSEIWICIDKQGKPVQSFGKYRECWGFYENICAVKQIKDDLMTHVDVNGNPISTQRWKWAGNFQSGVSVVANQEYYYINLSGTVVAGPFKYAGDFISGHATVISQSGEARILDKSFKTILEQHGLQILLPPHKYVCVAKDVTGFYHIDSYSGEEIQSQSQRYDFLEPFYNGRAVWVRGKDMGVLCKSKKNERASYIPIVL